MTLSYAVRDSVTMVRRNLLHARRYPALTFSAVFLPVIFLLTFVYLFGGAMGAGLGSAGGRSGATDAYLGYVTPGILVLAISSGAMSVAVAVNSDLTEGIINRFRTMAITRSAILIGPVVGSVILTVLSAVLPLQFLPFLGTAFVPADSMPTVLRWFATYQPFTPVIATFRYLLNGVAPGVDGLLALGWSLVLTVAGYLWAQGAFRRAAVR